MQIILDSISFIVRQKYIIILDTLAYASWKIFVLKLLAMHCINVKEKDVSILTKISLSVTSLVCITLDQSV